MDQVTEEDQDSAYIRFYDHRVRRAEELLIFMEETKIWDELLQDCNDRAGVDSGSACRRLFDIVTERNIYYNSRFNPLKRPTLTPGIPPQYERRRTAAQNAELNAS